MTSNLRIDDDLDYKIKHIAKEQQRSKNKQIEFILNAYVKAYEENNGQIIVISEEE